MLVRCEEVELILVDIINTLELCALIDRPRERANLDLKLFFKFVFRDAESEDESYAAKKARLKAEKERKRVLKKGGARG